MKDNKYVCIGIDS